MIRIFVYGGEIEKGNSFVRVRLFLDCDCVPEMLSYQLQYDTLTLFSPQLVSFGL
jgi:hypothetical protein